MRTEKRNCNFCKKELLITRSDQLKKEHNYCNTSCYNHKMKRKYIDGYRQCKNPECSNQFPYRNSLKIRGVRCYHTGVFIGAIKQMFCSRKCSLGFRNKFDNPARTKSGRSKISAFAKKRGIGHLHSKQAFEKRRKTITGKNHWNWQGGKTDESRKLRNSYEYKQWRNAVFIRDNYTCQECKAKSCGGNKVILNADHIKPFAFYPELRFDINNGKTLCLDCHKLTPTFAKKTL